VEIPTKGAIEDGLCESKEGTRKGLSEFPTKECNRSKNIICKKCNKNVKAFNIINTRIDKERQISLFMNYEYDYQYVLNSCC